MAYAIIGYFDSVSDERVRTLWKIFAERDICDYLYKSENNPHIKFAMYDDLNIDKVENALNIYTQNKNKIRIHFKNYGFYPNEQPILFIDISNTIDIFVALASIAFSINSFTTDAGRSTTSPAAILLAI